MAKQEEGMRARKSLIPDDATFLEGSEWRKPREEGIPVWLPVGQRLVRLRAVRPDHLLALGNIPDTLTSLVVDMIYGQTSPKDMDKFIAPRDNAAEALEMLESLRVICTAALVYPRVVAEPLADDEIRIDDLEIADRGYIFRLVFMPVDALSTFRYQPSADVVAVADGARDEEPTL